MFKAVCSECGADCEVPFKPSGDKPVLCSQCFKGGRDFSKPSFGDKPRFEDKKEIHNSIEKQFEVLHAKLDKIMAALKLEVEPVIKKEMASPVGKAIIKEVNDLKKVVAKVDVKKVVKKEVKKIVKSAKKVVKNVKKK
jgi:CxxC-x17-CxxC domain-containing protein